MLGCKIYNLYNMYVAISIFLGQIKVYDKQNFIEL